LDHDLVHVLSSASRGVETVNGSLAELMVAKATKLVLELWSVAAARIDALSVASSVDDRVILELGTKRERRDTSVF
jgi:hypothetical protein